MLDLQLSPLFEGISEKNVEKLCACLKAHKKEFKKDEFVLRSGDLVRSVYLILSGSMHIINEYYWGDRSIIETMGEATFFGEAYVFAKNKYHIVSIIAAEDSTVLEMNPAKLFEECTNSCACHDHLMRNVVRILSQKIVRLTEKVEHVVQRTTRGKILSYLSQRMKQSKTNPFTIPYSRQQLADYLCVDRSALSHELCKLRDEEMLRFKKNEFELLLAEDDIVL